MAETGEDNKTSVMEDPNAIKHLDALFEVIQGNPESSAGGGPTAQKANAKSWKERELPPSFFNAGSNPGPGMNSPDKYNYADSLKPQKPFPKLGPSINLGPPQMAHSHMRSNSMPANLESLSVNPVPLPPGWEASKTPDGLTYYIEWVKVLYVYSSDTRFCKLCVRVCTSAASLL